MENTQLKLIEFDTTWRLDPETIAVGKEGLRRARHAIDQATIYNPFTDNSSMKAAA